MRRGVVAVVVTALIAGACAEPTTPSGTAAKLQGRVAEIRSAIEAGHVYAARQRLGTLTEIVGRLMDRGTLDESTGMEILRAAEEVESLLDLAPERSPAPTETSTPPPSPTEEPAEDGGNEGEGSGQGHDKDKDKGNEGKGNGDEGHGNDD